jgi:hypothetical protein
MENNLYYTPTIEEFHVGFGYEYMNGDRWEESKMRIQDYKSDGPDYERSDSWFEEELLGGIRTVRVKYLDQSDIESLGWELRDSKKSPFTGRQLMTFQKTEEFGFNNGIHYWLIQQDDNWVIKIQAYSSYVPGEWVMRFKIKNKSELIKLMQQLNIK